MSFYHTTPLEEAMSTLETKYATQFCDGNETLAKAQMCISLNAEVKIEMEDFGKTTDSWKSFYFGLRLGLVVLLLLWTGWDCIMDASRHHNLWFSPIIIVYRSIG